MPKAALNPSVRNLGPSATLAINERSNALLAKGHPIYKFGLGQSPFPVPHSVVEALKTHAMQKDYLPVQGLELLRASVAAHHKRCDGLQFSAADILVGPGSKELIFLAQLVLDGEILIPSPAWVSYAPQAQIAGRRVTHLPTTMDNRWRVTPDQLENHCKQTQSLCLLILNYPGNPDGMTYSEQELSDLADVARRYGVLIISDEIYGLLHHTNQHVSIAKYYPEGTIVSSGLSKWCGAGGWRLGTFAFAPELSWLRHAMAAVASETFTSVSTPVQYAAVTAFDGGEDIDDYLWHSRRILKAIGMWATQRLRDCGISLHDPTGAFYLFPNLDSLGPQLNARGVTDSVTLCEQLLQATGVAILPGVVFGRPHNEHTVRLAYVNFDGEAALAASRLQPHHDLTTAFVQAQAPQIVQGIDAMCAWLNHPC